MAMMVWLIEVVKKRSTGLNTNYTRCLIYTRCVWQRVDLGGWTDRDWHGDTANMQKVDIRKRKQPTASAPGPTDDVDQAVPEAAQSMKHPPTWHHHHLSGAYRMFEDGSRSSPTVEICRGAIACSAKEFQEAWKRQPSPTPNPYNRDVYLRRRQGTFGGPKSGYRFSGQRSACMGPISSAPVVIQRCICDAQKRGGRAYGYVHVNWYDGGPAGIAAHQDDEHGQGYDSSKDIYSYSFLLRKDTDSTAQEPYRYFTVSEDRKQKKMKICVPTRNGDLVVMKGLHFQRRLWHSVPPTSRCDTKQVQRINVTVRKSVE